jgi:cell division protein FtsI (penicillin-binding protein 3)
VAEKGRRRSHIGDARAFTPRGRTVRDTDPIPRLDKGPDDKWWNNGAARRHETDRHVDDDRFDDEVDEDAGPRWGAASRRSGRSASGSRGAPAARTARTGGRATAGRTVRPAFKKANKPKRTVAPPRMGEPRRRIRLATAVALLLFVVIGFRLVQLQLTDAPAYAAAGLKERLNSVDLPAPRGSILDRTGAVLAHSIEARYVAADPPLVVDPVKTANLLSPLLGIAASDLLGPLQKKTREIDGGPEHFVWLARGVDVDRAKQVQDLKLPGIIVDRDERRDVPGDDLAANLIGFTGTDLTGLAGIEARFDKVLRGKDGKLTFEVGQGELRKPIPGGYQLLIPAQPGSSLMLTIDRDVQFMTQRILSERMRGLNATWAAAIVLDVRTGEVIAQASYPTYSAKNPFASNPADRGDMATGAVVDPGSIHKAIVLSAALQEGVVTPTSTIPIGPTVQKGDETYHDSHPFPEGTQITLPGLMAYSSNVATIKVASLLGADKLYQYQCAFGLGQETGIGVPGEAPGLVQPPANWSGTSYGSIPIGMGVSVTPLQMAAVYAAIANDGMWVQPHLIKETIQPNGTVVPAEAPPSHRVISPENAAALREIMEAVTTVPGATGLNAALPGYRISGKTGTGKQIKDGKYIPGEVASFIGMAPADQPRYVIAVFAHTPGGGGGAVAGPAFREMMGYTLRHFEVPPTGTKPPEFIITA